MITGVENGRIYLPAENPDKPNERTAMHPETNADQVIMNADGQTLNEFLGPQMIVSEDKPSRTCIWGQITATRI